MLQRPTFTKWLWCLFAIYAGPGWSRAVSVRTPPKNPTTIEAQAKFFQDFFSVQLSPYKIEFGHVCEDPNTWEQRYEKKDFKNHRDMGKVRWGDKHGGYGEHYWDLNHAGHAGNHGNDEYDSGSDDDGSYNHDLDHAHDGNDAYDEPSEQLPTYGTEEYDPEQAAKYDESGRAKRAHPRLKTERKLVRQEETYEELPTQKTHRKIKERLQAAPSNQEHKVKEVEENEQPKRKRRQRRPENEQPVKNDKSQNETNQNEQDELRQKQDDVQYYVKNKNEEQNQQQEPQYFVKNKNEEQTKEDQQPQYYVKRTETKYVPYEQGSGVRQHQHPELTPAASAPRLFLEPTTGHVVDRATGQAYVLQPVANNHYN